MKVLLDMDGVLVDFNRGMCEAHERDLPVDVYGRMPWAYHGAWGMSETEWWRPSNNTYFWENLPWTPDGKEILQTVLLHVPPEDVCLLTSPSLASESIIGKMRWIEREIPAFSRRYLMGPAKEFCASTMRVLIDDNETNCNTFYTATGWPLLVPRPWNSLYAETNVIDYLDRKLECYCLL